MTNKKITPEMMLKTLSDKPKIQADIARELGCYRSSPAKYLKQLEADGKAKKTETGWIRAEGRKAQVEKPVVNEYREDTPIEDLIKLIGVAGYTINDDDKTTPAQIDDLLIEDLRNNRIIMSQYLCKLSSFTTCDDIKGVNYEKLEATLKKIDMHAKLDAYLAAYFSGLRLRFSRNYITEEDKEA